MAGRCGGGAARNAGAVGRAIARGGAVGRAMGGDAGRTMGGSPGLAMAGGGAGRGGGTAGRAAAPGDTALLCSWPDVPTLTAIRETPRRNALKRTPGECMIALSGISLIAR
jgi:hypothetical protein